MINDRRHFIKTTALAGLGLTLARNVSASAVKPNAKDGGRIGIIGLDTSHVVAFTQTINENG